MYWSGPSTSEVVSVDAATWTQQWSRSVTLPPGIAFGLHADLLVDPIDGAAILLRRHGLASGPIDLLTRVDATGSVEYEFTAPAHVDPVVSSGDVVGTLFPYGRGVVFGGLVRRIALSADSSVLYGPERWTSPSVGTLVLGAPAAPTAAALWVAPIGASPALRTEIVDLAPSKDGRSVHVLLRHFDGDLLPLRAEVVTLDAATGAQLWSHEFADELGEVRTLRSLASGSRLAVVASRGTRPEGGKGGLLAILDAATGVELSRAEIDEPAGAHFVDAAFADAGVVHTVGTRSDVLNDSDGALLRWQFPPLLQGPDEVSVATGGTVELHVDLEAALAGDVYVVVGGVSGTSPGTPLPGGLTLPLNTDAYTDWSIASANSAVYQASLGLLDAFGDAHARLVVPPLPAAFVGLPLVHAAVAFDAASGTASVATQPVGLQLVP
ncbi:MAG: hypothetical protein R3F34_01410 [Planctomycetota bacterium]